MCTNWSIFFGSNLAHGDFGRGATLSSSPVTSGSLSWQVPARSELSNPHPSKSSDSLGPYTLPHSESDSCRNTWQLPSVSCVPSTVLRVLPCVHSASLCVILCKRQHAFCTIKVALYISQTRKLRFCKMKQCAHTAVS